MQQETYEATLIHHTPLPYWPHPSPPPPPQCGSPSSDWVLQWTSPSADHLHAYTTQYSMYTNAEQLHYCAILPTSVNKSVDIQSWSYNLWSPLLAVYLISTLPCAASDKVCGPSASSSVCVRGVWPHMSLLQTGGTKEALFSSTQASTLTTSSPAISDQFPQVSGGLNLHSTLLCVSQYTYTYTHKQ